MFSVIVILDFGWMQGRSRCVVCSCCNKPCFGSVRTVYGIGWRCGGGDGGGGVAEWSGERIADLIVTVEAAGLLDCVIISGDHVS